MIWLFFFLALYFVVRFTHELKVEHSECMGLSGFHQAAECNKSNVAVLASDVFLLDIQVSFSIYMQIDIFAVSHTVELDVGQCAVRRNTLH